MRRRGTATALAAARFVVVGLAVVGLAIAGGVGPARADDPKAPAGAHPAEKPKECVTFARRWADAVEEARLIVGPVVVHCLDFEARATWSYQLSVLCNKKYMDTAATSTVDVMGMINLEKAVARHDKRAATYDAVADGVSVKFLTEFPGLTVDDVVAMASSTAKYDTTGYAPYTAVVDPWTETSIQFFSGGQSAHSVLGAIADAKKGLEKTHGRGAARKDVRPVLSARATAKAKADAGDYAAAVKAVADAGAALGDKAPEVLKTSLADAKTAAVAAAEKALVALETESSTNPAGAKEKLTALLPKLDGTGLEARAKALLAKLG